MGSSSSQVANGDRGGDHLTPYMFGQFYTHPIPDFRPPERRRAHYVHQLACLQTIVPQFCSSLTNTTCACSSTQLAAAIEPCILGSCSIPDAFLFQRFSAEACGIPNDKSRQHLQRNVLIVLTAVVFSFVAARVVGRLWMRIRFGFDDWMIVAALLSYLAGAGIGIALSLEGFGQHTFWLSPGQISRALKVSTASMFHLYHLTVNSSSISVNLSTFLQIRL